MGLPESPRSLAAVDSAAPGALKGELEVVDIVPSNKDDGAEKKDDKKAPLEKAPYWKLFAQADAFDWVLIVAGFAGAAGAGAALPLFSILFGDFANIFGNDPGPDFMDQVAKLALKFTYLMIGATVGAYLEGSCWSWTSQRQTHRLKMKYLAAVLAQEVAFFDTQATTGGLLQGLSEDASDCANAISDKLGGFVHHSSTFIVGIIIALVKGWDMALVIVGCLPFLVAVGGFMAHATGTLQTKANEAYAAAGSITQQAFAQMRTVAAYNQQPHQLDTYERALDVPTQVGFKQSWVHGMSFGAVFFVAYNCYAVALIYGAWRVSTGNYTGGQVLSVLFSAILGGFSLGQAAPNFAYFSKGQVAAARIYKVIQRVPEVRDEPNATTLDDVKGAISLRDVAFAYPARPETQIFRCFNLEVPAGKTVALVGSSGSGKSTVVGLVERFYDPQSGVVLLDGVDLRTLRVSWLRLQIGLVSQEPTLFATTVLENIAMGCPGASREDVENAARLANAHKFIQRMNAGYDTMVGERGLHMSGGQKQRIAIARAILKNPKILLLDEATSALDTQSERVVQAALDAMIVGRTTVVVAHRLSTIKGADTIAVVQNGEVAELGTHEELLLNPLGAYTNLVKLQMQQGSQEPQKGLAGTTIAEAGEGVPEEDDEDQPTQGGQDSGSAPNGRVSTSDVVPHVAAASPAALTGAEGAAHLAAPPPAAADLPHLVHEIVKGIPVDGTAVKELLAGNALRAVAPATVAGAVAAIDLKGARTASSEVPEPYGVDLHGARTASSEIPQAAVKPAIGDGKGAADGGKGKDKGGSCFGRGKAEKGAKQDDKKADKTEQEIEDEAAVAAAANVPFKRLLALNKPEWRVGVMGGVASAACGVQQPAFAFVISGMIVNFYDEDTSKLRSKASFYAWMFFVIAVGTFAATVVQHVSFGFMAMQLSRRLRMMLFKSILYQEIGWFDEDNNTSGKLSARLSSDATYVRGAVGDTLGLILQNLFTLIFGYLVAFAYDWRMALLITGVIPLVVVAASIQMKFMFGTTAQNDKSFASANQTVTEAFTSIRVIQAYNLQPVISGLYVKLTSVGMGGVARHAQAAGLGFGFSHCVMFGMYGLVIYFGGWEINQGLTDFNGMLKAFMSVLLAAMGMGQAAAAFPDMGKAKAAIGRIFPTLDRTPAIIIDDPNGIGAGPTVQAAGPEGGAKQLALAAPASAAKEEVDVEAAGEMRKQHHKAFAAAAAGGAVEGGPREEDSEDGLVVDGARALRGELQFQDVSFVYPSRPTQVIFSSFNLTVEAGQVTAMVGESGSGKSTVVGLVERFYDVQSGRVLVDGVDIRRYNLRWLRSQIGLVSQEPLLFNGTIWDNITMGVASASMEAVRAAAQAANAITFVDNLAEKFSTRVGEGGIQLSGGQKQRIAIARAVFKNPKILLLDEATSALDAQSERVVQAALDRIMVGRTSIVVAHRLSTIRHANAIAVVYRGKVLERGTHEELMAIKGGNYARLVAAQSQAASGDAMDASLSKAAMALSASMDRLATQTSAGAAAGRAHSIGRAVPGVARSDTAGSGANGRHNAP